MSELTDTLENLHDTQARMALLRQQIGQYPDRKSLLITLQSLENRHSQLEQAFAESVERSGLDLCSYRLFQKKHFRPFISAIGHALVDFQRLVSVVYDSIKSGPKYKTKLAPDVIEETAFSFGYSFAGSLGIVMTAQNETFMLEEIGSRLDESIRGILDMARCESSDQVAFYSKKFGASSIRQMQRWAKTHIDQDMGADIEWRRGNAVRQELIIEPPRFVSLVLAISETSDEETILIHVTATLIAMDAKTHSFKLEAEEIGVVAGKASEYVATMANTVELPKRYEAELRKTTKINYAVEEEEVSWFLVSLTPA